MLPFYVFAAGLFLLLTAFALPTIIEDVRHNRHNK